MRIVSTLLILSSLGAPAQAPNLETKAQQYMQDQVARSGFSGAVLLGRSGKVLFARGYGLANAEWNIPNTPRTKFRTGSIAKQFTAAAILLLQEQKKLSVQDRISRYVEDLPVAWRAITLHQLLTHTSGIPNYTGSPDMPRVNRLGASPRQLLALVQDKPLQFSPGTRLSYSNTGYILLGMVIEKASGEPYAGFVEQRVFSPLGMRDTGYDITGKVLPERAEGYQVKEGKLEHADFLDMSVPWAAGAFYSTVEDLFRWSEALAGGKLLSQESRKQRVQVYPETTLDGKHYGYGVVLAEQFGQPQHYHAGGVHGFTSSLEWYPQSRVSVVVMSNVESVRSWDIATGLAALVLDGPR